MILTITDSLNLQKKKKHKLQWGEVYFFNKKVQYRYLCEEKNIQTWNDFAPYVNYHYLKTKNHSTEL